MSDKAQSDWISRQVASFGRYPKNRPQGLSVDSAGAMKLSSLMTTWGQKHSLSRDDIVQALQKNRFHDHTSLRFAMLEEADGEVSISVHRKRENVTEASLAKRGKLVNSTPSAATGQGEDGASEAAPGWTSWLLRKGGPGLLTKPAGKLVPKRKEPEGGKLDPPWRPWAGHCDRGDRWQQGYNGSKGSNGWQQGGGSKGSNGGQGDNWNNGVWSRQGVWSTASRGNNRGEQVQKWLSYALKTGGGVSGIKVADGWAMVDEVAEVLGRRRPDLGITDGQQLWELLRDTDEQGRFETDQQGRVRKVEREERQQRSPAISGTPKNDLPEGAVRPPHPPGDNWVKYTDDGVLWWFYDGPLGKWWMTATDEEPQLWKDEDQGDEEAASGAE